MTKIDASSLLAMGLIDHASLIHSFDGSLTALRNECKYWASKGNKSKLKECQGKYKILVGVLDTARHISNN